MDNRKLAILLGSAAVLLLVLGLLLMPGKSEKSQRTGKNASAINGNKAESDYSARSGSNGRRSDSSDYRVSSASSGRSSSASRGSSAGYSSGRESEELVPKRTYTEKEMQELRRKREELRKEMYDRKLKWVQEKVNDESLSAKSRYRYRLKMIDGFRKGNDAFNKGDYVDALKEYMKGLKDPDGNEETKFMCLMQMRMTAKMLKDYDLYLELLKQQSQMIEEHNLQVFGIEKGKSGWPLYESRRRYIMAIKEPDGIDKAVDEIMKDNFFLDKKDREEIREKFINDMEEFKKDFESTRELLTTGEET
jgi:hypothetical protein